MLSALILLILLGAYHPAGVEKSRTLLSEGVVGFRLVFSGIYGFDSYNFLHI